MQTSRGISRRAFLQWSSALGATALLAACAPAAAPTGSSGAASPAQATIKLRFQSREPENAAGVQQLWDEFYQTFREANPNVEVEFLPTPGGDIRENAMTQIVAGDAPDLFEFCCQDSTFFVQQGETLNLQPLIEQDAEEVNLDDYYKNQFDPWKDQQGDIHLLPRFTGTQVIFYNIDMFDEMGVAYPPSEWGDWTWQDYQQIGRQFASQEQPARYGSANYGMNANWLTQYWIRGFGSHMVNPDDKAVCDLCTDGAMQALEWIHEIIWEDYMFAPQSQAAGSGLGPLELFLGQRSAMMEMGPWNLGPVADGAQFRWDVAPMPDGPAGMTTHQSVDGTFIWKGTKNPDASWELLKGVTSPNYGRLYAKYATKQPSRKSVINDFVTLLREQNPVYQEVRLEVFTDSIAQDIGGPEEMFWPNDFVSKSQILTPAFDRVMMLNSAPVELICKHAEVVTKFNRGEIAVEDIGAALDALQ
jgi:multiple sugar transport system substrate-binding protein